MSRIFRMNKYPPLKRWDICSFNPCGFTYAIKSFWDHIMKWIRFATRPGSATAWIPWMVLTRTVLCLLKKTDNLESVGANESYGSGAGKISELAAMRPKEGFVKKTICKLLAASVDSIWDSTDSTKTGRLLGSPSGN